MVKSEEIFSPQNFLELVTGNCYLTTQDDDVRFIEDVLRESGYNCWSYPLSEIDHVVENKLDVVLVDCMVWNGNTDRFDHEYRWFEVP